MHHRLNILAQHKIVKGVGGKGAGVVIAGRK